MEADPLMFAYMRNFLGKVCVVCVCVCVCVCVVCVCVHVCVHAYNGYKLVTIHMYSVVHVHMYVSVHVLPVCVRNVLHHS